MPSKVAETLDGLRVRIIDLLKVHPSPPIGYFTLGIWMAQNLTIEEINRLNLFDLENREQFNDWIVQAMLDTGRYFLDEEEYVRLKERGE